MIKGSAKSAGKHLRERIAIATAALAVLLTAGGASAEERPAHPRPDFSTEIQIQGATALQEMTRQLKRELDWGKRGAAALAAALEHPAATDHQVAGNIESNCKRCHENRERG